MLQIIPILSDEAQLVQCLRAGIPDSIHGRNRDFSGHHLILTGCEVYPVSIGRG
jgi:hypothetical protein